MASNSAKITNCLLDYVEEIQKQFFSDGGRFQFTGDAEADDLLHSDPNAFFLAMIFNQQIPGERAGRAPLELKRRLGHLDMARIAAMDLAELSEVVNEPPALHRYTEKMPGWIKSAAQLLVDHYSGDAGRIWPDGAPTFEVQGRLRAFPGFGQKKASNAVNLLVRQIGKELVGGQWSEVSYDVHIRRVFLRTGLADRDDESSIQFAARTLNPSDPGALDLPAWHVGRNWCRPREPLCGECRLRAVCMKSLNVPVP